MKIGIIGGNGKAGAAVYQEALKRGHQPTAIVRNAAKAQGVLGADATLLVKDGFELTREDLTAFDVVIDAFGVPMGSPLAYLHLDLLTRIVHELRETQTRLGVIIGAASLTMPDGRPLLDHLMATPGHEDWIGVPLNQTYEHAFLQMIDNVDWFAVSPQREFKLGPASSYVMGDQKVMFDADGRSELTTGNMALAILDELETPTHIRQRFTVRNQEAD
ncbi:NAD(P)H-binding protein [Secundilactobacillus similis]|uniref:Coenzyme F420-dependent NADP oxidoreductase n=1 Tax=Secundilactobacillus similis DSM 23365 = JCM 2765 TaxID=1423804 RepID=A0A0R2FC34_9LACO|nr:NAD(P)H-binding protein [Secundilactobacillus similis]KRN26050.1 coenzyme F420-dependent NADP oxidoreductase [Secundilactobacillus similis DSM 23365 = JCM 2765]